MATWLKLNQSYMTLQIYARQNEATAVPFKPSCAQHRALTDLKNKLARARGHSYHMN